MNSVPSFSGVQTSIEVTTTVAPTSITAPVPPTQASSKIPSSSLTFTNATSSVASATLEFGNIFPLFTWLVFPDSPFHSGIFWFVLSRISAFEVEIGQWNNIATFVDPADESASSIVKVHPRAKYVQLNHFNASDEAVFMPAVDATPIITSGDGYPRVERDNDKPENMDVSGYPFICFQSLDSSTPKIRITPFENF